MPSKLAPGAGIPPPEGADCTIGSRSALPVVTAGVRRGSPTSVPARGWGGMIRIVRSAGDVSFLVDGMYCGSLAPWPLAFPWLATNVPPGALSPCAETALAGDERTIPGPSPTASTTAAAATRRPLLSLLIGIDVLPPLLSGCLAHQGTHASSPQMCCMQRGDPRAIVRRLRGTCKAGSATRIDPDPGRSSAQILVRLHVEPHREERELRARDQEQGDQDDCRRRDVVAEDPQHRLEDPQREAEQRHQEAERVEEHQRVEVADHVLLAHPPEEALHEQPGDPRHDAADADPG